MAKYPTYVGRRISMRAMIEALTIMMLSCIAGILVLWYTGRGK